MAERWVLDEEEFFKADLHTYTVEEICEFLRRGEIVKSGLIPWGSNYTFLVALDVAQAAFLLGVYKPRRGEAPLWDFPDGTLYKREYAAFVLSEALGWRLVPPTVMRDGPDGIGTVQLYMHHQREEADYFSIRDHRTREVKMMAVFDVLANNTDRKAGHCLQDENGHVWGIDHGLTFNLHSGLRTVIWDFCGERVPKRLLRDIRRVCDDLEAKRGMVHELRALLSAAEIAGLDERMQAVLRKPILPDLQRRRSVPWSFQ